MNQPSLCQDLEIPAQILITLADQAGVLKPGDSKKIKDSLNRAISPKFEIVFAGAYSAGKSMLINALLQKELLYSSSGHATGTECRIQAPDADGKEKIILTFLSRKDIGEQIRFFLVKLKDANLVNKEFVASFGIDSSDLNEILVECEKIIESEGGKDKTAGAEGAYAIKLLIQGLQDNMAQVLPERENEVSMEDLGIEIWDKAVSFVRQGANSAILKRVDYYHRNELLEAGNVIIDTPGIDAPFAKDAALTYRKLNDPEVSAVVCVFKSATFGNGELSQPERDLLARIRANESVGNRVFTVFNYIDNTWYEAETKRRLETLISEQFQNSRIYKTSALLGFYGSLIKKTDVDSRYGLNTIFAKEVGFANDKEETPKFVSEFIRYCGPTGRLKGSPFHVQMHSDDESNDAYLRIISEHGLGLIDHLIHDSGIETFRKGITDYLVKEKSPQLYKEFASNLLFSCSQLRSEYNKQYQALVKSQPSGSQSKRDQIVVNINDLLQSIGSDYHQAMQDEINSMTSTDLELSESNNFGRNAGFPRVSEDEQCEILLEQYTQLKRDMMVEVENIENLSLKRTYRSAVNKQLRNSTMPIGVLLSEPFEAVSANLEKTLRSSVQQVIETFFDYLIARITNDDNGYIRELQRLVGTDSGIEQTLRECAEQVKLILDNHAIVECDRYRREDSTYYGMNHHGVFRQQLLDALSNIKIDAEDVLSLDLKKQIVQIVLTTIKALTLGPTSASSVMPKISHDTEGFGIANVSIDQENKIKGYLRENFRLRVHYTVNVSFPQVIRQTLKTTLNRVADSHRTYIAQLASSPQIQSKLDLLAEEEEKRFAGKLADLSKRVSEYNVAIATINHCLGSWNLDIVLPQCDMDIVNNKHESASISSEEVEEPSLSKRISKKKLSSEPTQ